MKNLTITLLFAALGLFAFLPNAKNRASRLNGAWEMYSKERGGKTTFYKKPAQMKVYNDGYFCIMGYDSTGKFSYAGAGTYELDGNHYNETFTYHSHPKYVGLRIWDDWAKDGDTLLFYGVKKVLMGDGTDKTASWGGDSFVEKKVRVKK